MRPMLTIALLLLTSFAQRPRGVVTAVSASPGNVASVIQFTVTGNNPCGAVFLDYGDGIALTHPIVRVPTVIAHEYKASGAYQIQARGMGDCDGEATTSVRVTLPRAPAPPPPPPAPAAPVAPTEARPREMDRNGDGVVSRQEWRGSDEAFRVHDWNRDGALSGDEISPGAKFDHLDRNGNGRVERAEWLDSVDTFAWLDRNRDGVLTRVEVVGEDPKAKAVVSGDLFSTLDVDRDQRVSLEEWKWTRATFDDRDANMDGLLTRRELGTAAPGPLPRPSSEVSVSASERWTDTGLVVTAGDMLVFTATGVIKLSTEPSDLADPQGARSNRRAANAPLPRDPAGALIARIEMSAPMLIGARTTPWRAPRSGRLFLGINDDYLGDNRGEFKVTVAVAVVR